MKTLYGLILLSLFIPTNGIAAADLMSLECQIVPQKNLEICSLSTQAEHFPVNDLILYKREKGHLPVLIEVIKGDVAISWFWGFSTQGKYSVMSFAEEGHPYFVVFETEAFLQTEQRPTAIAVVSDYFLESLIELQDDGTAVFAYSGSRQTASDGGECVDAQYDNQSLNENCFVTINILDKSHDAVN
ncbi:MULTISPECIES: hypothetical protein [Alteromonadaceae]|uniref:hypothetical protein n=1 Tax=Alteromonadaceae TaxID=72275 RepID=UPI001C097F89|nr:MULTISPECIES: hypothetical protein [Aliiglaciecola]MBU2879300.1 hypothetical protein [Aliiglaciecola lipolytica]MDO6709752.1 hypothetical protein [Aliiglaciecola sp. 2_MG-2023]MDO6750706.1 hypothetical protein [Aliiglaciecola sp. 1_MG-2023]